VAEFSGTCQNCEGHAYADEAKSVGPGLVVHADLVECVRSLSRRLEALEDRTRQVPLPDDD